MGTHLAAPFANFQNSLILRERSDMSEDKVFIPEIVEDGSSFDKEKQGPKTKVKIGCAAVGLSYFILMAVGLIIYVWTIGIAYDSAGIAGAMLSMIFPFFAQIFWFFKLWNDTGTIFDPYCVVVISYVVLTMFMRAGSKILFFGRGR